MSELEKILKEMAVDEGYLTDWYINSTDDSDPVWTEEHIEELVGDFILIPKSEVRNHMNDGWISVEERLPTEEECKKDNAVFLVQSDTRERFSCEYDRLADGYNNPFWCCSKNIIAWRPLPEPYQSERNKESKAGNTDAFVNEIKTLQLKQVFEVVELADKYNLDRNDVFKQYTEATISVQKTVDLENPENLSKEEVRHDRE